MNRQKCGDPHLLNIKIEVKTTEIKITIKNYDMTWQWHTIRDT